MKKMNNKAQEEMVGFALIVGIVSIIILVFLFLALRDSPQSNVRNEEVANFILAILQHTTTCEINQGFLNVGEVISDCYSSDECLDGRKACDVLEEEVGMLLEKSWNVGNESLYKGYYLGVYEENMEILNLTEGELKGNYKGASEPLGGDKFVVEFRVYEN